MAVITPLVPKRKLDDNLRSTLNYLEPIAASETLRVINANDAQPVLKLVQSGSGENLLLTHATQSELRFTEEDQTDPAGRYRFRGFSGAFAIEKAASANWASNDQFFVLDPSGKAIQLYYDQLGDDYQLTLGAVGAIGASVVLHGEADASPSIIELRNPNGAKTGMLTRLSISGNNDTAVATWASVTHTGIKLSGTLDANNQEIDNIKTLNMSSGTELTISSGAVTATQGHHSIDTEGDASTDDLDTINGLEGNDLIFLFAADGDHTVRVRNSVGNIFLRHQNETRAYHFSSPSGSSGTFYSAGEYFWSATEAILTQGSTTVTHGSANVSYAAHASIVAKGDGAKTSGDLVITVTGTSIDDDGNRDATPDSEVIVADATSSTFGANAYAETTKKWLGTVTFTLSSSGGGNFNCSFNYGFSKYEDFGNQNFTINLLECVGFAGATDTGFNIRLFHHNSADWTYAAAGFVPGPTASDTSELANMNTDHNTEINLANGEPISYKRANLNTDVSGTSLEGVIIEITTGANKAVEDLDIHIGVHTQPRYLYLAEVTQHVLFMQHGGDFHQV